MLKSELLRKESVIEHTENYWKSFDNINLYAQTWHASGKPKAVIHLIHDFNEHSSRFDSWAQQISNHGFTVRSFDLRGLGRSEGKRRDSSDYQKFLRDIESFIEQGKKEFPGIPVFLYGQGFGGNLAINYAIQQNLNISGLIVSSPCFEPVKKYSHSQIFLLHFLGTIFPAYLINIPLKAEDISRDLRVVYNYKNDPLIHNKISLRLAYQIIETGKKASMSIYKINVPLLVMHGCNDNVASCKASKDFVRNASERTTFIEWERGFHELHNDIDRDKVLDSVLTWLNKFTG